MVVKLDLRPEIEAGLVAEASKLGISLEDYLQRIIQDHAIQNPELSAEAWETEFDDWVSSFPDTPLLSDEAISRESMYPDRW